MRRALYMDGVEKNRITVDIFGTPYKMVGNTTINYMKMVASHVDEHMHRIAESNNKYDTTRTAVLAAVNMADEFYQIQSELEKVWEDLKQSRHEIEELRRVNEDLSKLKQENVKWDEERNALEFELRKLQLYVQESNIRGQEAEKEAAERAELDNHYKEQISQLQQAAEQQRLEHAEELEKQANMHAIARTDQDRLWKARLHAKELDWKHLLQEKEQSLQAAAAREEEWSQSAQSMESLKTEYSALSDEYEKLKKEYNEWIQLVLENE